MPNVSRITSPFLGPTGNPDTLATPITANPAPGSFTPYAPGELGCSFDYNDKTYEFVVVDSGCTSATPTGVVAINQLLFWKDKTNRIVTNDQRFAVGGQTTNAWRNSIAGIARLGITTVGALGTYIAMLTRGASIPVLSDGTGGVGQRAVANSGSAGDVTPVAVGTAATYNVVGVMRGAAANSLINVDVDIPSLP